MEFQNVPSEEVLNHFTTSIEGLTEGEAQERLTFFKMHLGLIIFIGDLRI